IEFNSGDMNLYRYVFNSPVNYFDPDGEGVWLPAIVIGGAVCGLTTLAGILYENLQFKKAAEECAKKDTDGTILRKIEEMKNQQIGKTAIESIPIVKKKKGLICGLNKFSGGTGTSNFKCPCQKK
ncbi:MAG: hypothetical protein OXJ52_01530, partial [Oligoflexia bacterium]|nr:hypothetical protein [Oligoflexia bacterium]